MIDPLTVGIRFALYVNLMLLFGLPLFGLYALKGVERVRSNVMPFRALVGWLSASAIGLSLLSIVAMTASMMGVSLFEADRASISMMIAETPMGQAWQARIVALAVTLYVAVAMGARKTPTWLVFVSLGSAAALASLAWTGHGAASAGVAGTRHLIADIIHLLAAGAWLGALVALGLLLFRPVGGMSQDHLRLAHHALNGFSVAGGLFVALVVLSGLVNSWVMVGPQNILTFHTTLYGQVLIAKLSLFGAMLALAAANRSRLTLEFNRVLQSGGTSGAIMTLRKNLALELSSALIILGLVAWLGTLQPPMSM